MNDGHPSNGSPGRYLLVGGSVGHSLSPGIWRELFAAAGVNDQLEGYDAVDAELPGIFDALRDGSLRGAWFTMPFKQTAARMADRREPSALRSGATNLVLLQEGELVARNTDALAVAHLLGPRRFDRGLLLGAGGAARAAAAGLVGHCDALTIAGMEADQADALAVELTPMFASVSTVAWEQRASAASVASLIVHATPLGMDTQPQTTPLDSDEIPASAHVYDFVYRGDGALTPLGDAVQAAGAALSDGLAHLVAQAVCALPVIGLPEHLAEVIARHVEAVTGHGPRHWSAV